MDSDSMLCGPVDEEERWLDALEKGELDDNGELKKEIDESLLTARQVRKGHDWKWYETIITREALLSEYFSTESPAAQAAEPASVGAANGLQGEGDDRRNDAEARGASSQETPAGRQESWGEQEPDDRKTNQNQQGQN